MNVKKILLIFLQLLLHVLAIGFITYSLWPIVSWYLGHRPILGVDFYNTASYARFFSRSFTLLPNGFFDAWYAGTPVYSYTVISWFYPIAVVAKFIPLIDAVKMFMAVIIFLIAVFTYLAAYRLCQNYFLSTLIAVSVGLSANLYGSLAWGGSLPYFANQIFFPLILFLIGNYLASSNSRWFWSAVLISGLAMYGHLNSAGAIIFPSTIILLLFGSRSHALSIWKKIREVFIYLIVTNLFAVKFSGQNAIVEVIQSVLTQFLTRFNSSLAGPLKSGSDIVKDVGGGDNIAAFYKNQVWTLFTDTHQLLFLLLIVAAVLYLLTLLIFPQRTKRLGTLAWVLVSFYSFIHVYLNANGVNFLPQGWYRAYWYFPITVGLAAAALFGASQATVKKKFSFTGFPLHVFVGFISIMALVFVFIQNDVTSVIAMIDKRSSPASAHPEAINLVRNQKELDVLKTQLLPAWIPGDDKNYRMFTSDAQVNVWWSSLFDMPLVRGYLDAPGDAGYHFLLDQAVGGDDLVNNFDYTPESARNMALYYLDWYAVKYGEGGHLSKSPNKSYSTYLEDVVEKKEEVGVKGAYILYETESGKPEIKDNVEQYLNYYKFSDSIVSPLALVSHAPALLCICDRSTHESLNKIFGLNAINSQSLINVYENSPIDSFSKEELQQFSMVYLSNYRYRNKNRAFALLSDYIMSGGNVFIDTGGETPESRSQSVPDLFPFGSLVRKGLGREWDISLDTTDPVTTDLNWNMFSPLLYDNNEWNLSYPDGDIESGAQVLVSQAGKPLIIRKKAGRGTLIWSGINLAYHVQYYTNVTESKFVLNLLRSLIDLNTHDYSEGELRFKNSADFTFTSGELGKGVLVKIQHWPNWQISVNGKGVKSYAAGPSFPGFIYIPLKESQKVNIHAIYWGEPGWWFWVLISLVTGLILVDLSVFSGLLGVRFMKSFTKNSHKLLTRWWEKEEE